MIQSRLTYAGRPERLFAYLIDSIIVLLPSFIVVALLKDTGFGLIGAFICNAAYYTYSTASRWQASPGKRLLGIYVIRTNGQPMDKEAALERFLAYLMPSLPMYASFIPPNIAPILIFWLSLLWFLPILTTPERIGMHDRLCRTRVVIGKPA